MLCVLLFLFCFLFPCGNWSDSIIVVIIALEKGGGGGACLPTHESMV